MRPPTTVRLQIERLSFEGFGPREREQIVVALESHLLALVRAGEPLAEPRRKRGRRDGPIEVRGQRAEAVGMALATEVYRQIGPALNQQTTVSNVSSDARPLGADRRGGDNGSDR